MIVALGIFGPFFALIPCAQCPQGFLVGWLERVRVGFGSSAPKTDLDPGLRGTQGMVGSPPSEGAEWASGFGAEPLF